MRSKELWLELKKDVQSVFSSKLIADMSLIGPLNSKFQWYPYIFPNLAIHFHLMP